jgi:hypothetical protein
MKMNKRQIMAVIIGAVIAAIAGGGVAIAVATGTI